MTFINDNLLITKSLSTSPVQTLVPLQAMLLMQMIMVLLFGLKNQSLTAFRTIQLEYFDLEGA